jgi:hypothetical protein
MYYQAEEETCAPVALMNLASWAGRMADFREMAALCGTDKDGTDDEAFFRAMDALKPALCFTWVDSRMMPAAKLGSYLSFDSNAALVSHLDRSGDWHWSFWHASWKGHIVADNLEFRSPDQVIDYAEAEVYLKTGDRSLRKLVLVNIGRLPSEAHSAFRLPAEFTAVKDTGVAFDPARCHWPLKPKTEKI